jgi:protein-arginine kinase activator protein McsA
MKCDLCENNEAHVHVTQVFGDVSQKVDLCEACAVSSGVNDPKGFSLATLMERMKKKKQPGSDQFSDLHA